jgi:hypothetical protein
MIMFSHSWTTEWSSHIHLAFHAVRELRDIKRLHAHFHIRKWRG